jgi:predicted DNA-binding transcriptional regulator YafY
LIEYCNNAICEYSGIEDGVHRHQIYDDIRFMEEHWDIPLLRKKDGRRTYFVYSKRNFTICDRMFNDEDIEKVKSALDMLCKFKGIPNFEWVNDIDAHFRTTFQIGAKLHKQVVEFDNNPYVRGLDFFGTVFNAIVNNIVVKVNYQPFYRSSRFHTIHPYFLKQYAYRWYLIALDDYFRKLITLPLDRMISIEPTQIKYIPNEDIDFIDYFFDAIGITVPQGCEVMDVRLKITSNLLPFIETKPIHGSQKIVCREADDVYVEMHVYDTYELQSQILSYGPDVEVIAPLKLRDEISELIKKMGEKYL